MFYLSPRIFVYVVIMVIVPIELYRILKPSNVHFLGSLGVKKDIDAIVPTSHRLLIPVDVTFFESHHNLIKFQCT